MPLDLQVEALLAGMAAAGANPFQEMTPAEGRVAAWAFKDLGGEPEAVAAVENRFIPGPTADLSVRIYRPEGEGPFPALVYFHCSGWVILNIEICDAACRMMANRRGASSLP